MKSTQSRVGRRDFLKGVALCGVASFVPALVPASAQGLDGTVSPSEKINLGAIGIGSRGGEDFRIFLGRNDIRSRAIRDGRRTRRKTDCNAAK